MFLECPSCILAFEGEVLAEYTFTHPDDYLDAHKYTFTKCPLVHPKCNDPILLKQEREVDYDAIYWGGLKILYPRTDFHINPVIPVKLREALQESVRCFRAKSYTATAIMCRRTIEGLCENKKIKERTLDLSIKKLKEEGLINEQLYEWANELRLIGNEAAHNIEVGFSATDARDILDFTIAILDFTYSFKDKFDKFRKRLKGL